MLPGLDQHLDGHVIGDVPPSMSSRQISYSVSLAEGKPISISLMPTSTRVWKYSSFS